MYLEKRRRRWYAIHEIPEDVREALGQGKQFFKGLETEDRRTAERRAALLEARWRAEIEAARKGTTDHIEKDAMFWRKVLRDTPEQEREIVIGFLADEAQERVEQAAAKAGIIDHRDPAYDELQAHDEAARFFALATGKMVKLDEHVDEWLATLNNEAKSKDMKKSTVLKFAQEFPYTRGVKRKDVQKWVNKQAQDGKKPATIQRSLSELRGYWAYLTSIEVVSENDLPFEKLSIPKPSKKEQNGDGRKPFTAQQVVDLVHAAEAKGDTDLADLIRLGMWTGARIESLCALKVDDVKGSHFSILDDKTAAGVRDVPIHPKLKPTIARLIKDSKDGYVLSGLTENKYGDRSNAIGKRFGRLKTDLKFGDEHVFHSIRKTVVTLLDNAGVAENVAADIVGHDKPTMTYGLYSGGSSLEVKRQALELISYPGM